MWLVNRRALVDDYIFMQFQGSAPDCRGCPLRKRCLRNENQKTARQFSYQLEKGVKEMTPFENMKAKIDSKEGKIQYSKRLGIIEPILANIVSNIGLKRFSLGGESKINAQWLLFTLVHNIGKIQKYGTVSG